MESLRVKRSLRIELNNADKTTNIVLGYLTYHAGKLWNEANYLVKWLYYMVQRLNKQEETKNAKRRKKNKDTRNN